MTINLQVPGALPVSPLRVIETPVTRAIHLAVDTAVGTNMIGAISGPPGVGKTTTSAIAAAACGGPVVYVDIKSRASARQNFTAMFEAVTGTPAKGTAVHIQADLRDHLVMYPTTMLIDDAHQIGLDGLILIKGLFDAVTTIRGEGTPIILVGNALTNSLAVLPELVSRLNGRAEARYLTSAEVIDAIHVLEPRTRFNDHNTLYALDRTYFKGELRQWAVFFRTLNMIGGTSLTEPYPDDNIKEAIIRGGIEPIKARKGRR